jgi:hypothetical protein
MVCDITATQIKLNPLFINMLNSAAWRTITEPIQILEKLISPGIHQFILL